MNEVTHIKPFLKWVGGKTQLLNEIDKRLPTNVETYIEPFVSGGSVLIHIMQTRPDVQKFIVNDLNENLIDCYTDIKNLDSFTKLLNNLIDIQSNYNSAECKKDFYYEYRSKYNDLIELNIKDTSLKSALFIFLNKTGFNGLYRVNKLGRFNVPFNNAKYFNPDFENLKNLHTLFNSKDIKFYHCDYIDFLENINPETLYNDIFVYMDPPYKPVLNTLSEVSYTKSGFDDYEQLKLKYCCDDLSEDGIMFLQSNSDPVNSTFFDDLYRDYKIDRVLARRSINSDGTKRGQINEIMISNF